MDGCTASAVIIVINGSGWCCSVPRVLCLLAPYFKIIKYVPMQNAKCVAFFFPLPFLLFFHFVCLFAFAPSNALCFVPMFSLADQRWVPRGWLWTLLGSKMKNTGCRGEVASLNGLIPTKARCDSHWRLAWRGQPLPWGARE